MPRSCTPGIQWEDRRIPAVRPTAHVAYRPARVARSGEHNGQGGDRRVSALLSFSPFTARQRFPVEYILSLLLATPAMRLHSCYPTRAPQRKLVRALNLISWDIVRVPLQYLITPKFNSSWASLEATEGAFAAPGILTASPPSQPECMPPKFWPTPPEHELFKTRNMKQMNLQEIPQNT
ncbi:hypothetical protein B0H17DRAFT_1125609 [Mycena rosella]|uniref:Uncharacterized protein n=1 Tax=Mycena rosella TaxID=1033263 RepID=A0AAD7GWM0_MYCRO|nr:hypothetical protein B0H17DRAFT_1125609 [Mycena rosella]